MPDKKDLNRIKIIKSTDWSKEIKRSQSKNKGMFGDRRNSYRKSSENLHPLSKVASALPVSGLGAVRGAPRKVYDPLIDPTSRDIPYYDDNLAYDDDDILKESRAWCRFYYNNHHLVASATNIFAKYPLVGMSHKCKNKEIEEFFDKLFLDELRYPEFLLQLNTSYWREGEAITWGQFSESEGVWVKEIILNPDDVKVVYNEFMDEREFYLAPNDRLKTICRDKTPEKAYLSFAHMGLTDEEIKEGQISAWPEKIAAGECIPLPEPYLQFMKYGGTPWSPRGYPIMMRAFSNLLMEHRFRRAEVAVAERLNTPLILVTVGLDAQKLGSEGPWFPNKNDLMGIQTAVETAMMSDTRTIVAPMGIEIKDVFNRTQAPRWDAGYDRIDKNILGVYGISEDLLRGGKTQSFATTALSVEFLQQELKTDQDFLKRFCYSRYEKIAEAWEMYDYNDDGKPIYTEELLIYPDGTEELIQKRKLLYPEVVFQTIDFRDIKNQQEFLKQAKAAGMPISDNTYLSLAGIDAKKEEDMYVQEEAEKQIREVKVRLLARQLAEKEGILKEYDALSGYEKIDDNLSTPLPTQGEIAAEEAVKGNADEEVDPGLETAGTRPEVSDKLKEDSEDEMLSRESKLKTRRKVISQKNPFLVTGKFERKNKDKEEDLIENQGIDNEN